MQTHIDILLAKYKVKSYKTTQNNLVAIRKGGMWLYFRGTPTGYVQTGSTLHFEK